MPYSFCVKCAKPVEQQGKHAFACASCGFVLYRTSKPTASALIVRGSEILLGRRGINPSKGLWDIPGGFCDFGEHPEDAVRREVFEETGLRVEPVSMLDIVMDEYGTDRDATMNIAYVVRVTGGSEQAGDDVVELRWFRYDALPTDIAFENGRRMLEMWVKSFKGI